MNVHRSDLARLGAMLRADYQASDRGDRTTALHLFGVVHADELSELSRAELDQVALAAGLSASFGTELRKMVKLARHVVPRPSVPEPLSTTFARLSRPLPPEFRFDREEANAR